MISEDQILVELKKLNEELRRQNNTVLKSFSYGFFHSLGYFFGTTVVFFVFIYLAAQFDLTKALSKSFESMMSQVNWNKIVPAPKIQLLPDQQSY